MQLRLHEVEIEDAGERFSFNRLNGTLHWGSDAATRTTTLYWAGGRVYRLELGAAQVSVRSHGMRFECGIEPTENVYYIVKSRFIPPRIDVIGYSDRVDWRTLIDRLKSVTLVQPPEVR